MPTDTKTQPFSEHIKELRQRLIYLLSVVVLGCGVGYALHKPLFNILQKPLGQQLYYTTPIGGFNAMLKISVLVGLVAGVPFLIYQLCQFVGPAFKNLSPKRPFRIFVFSVLLAAAGASFGYFVSLPAALRFLTHIDSGNIQPLIVVGDYLNFVFSYLVSFAVLFQLPLIMLFINRIKPQKPSKLIRHQRWVILISFILAAILTPTPDPINQLIMAAPIILLYQFSVALVWLQNRQTAKTVVPQPAVAIKELTTLVAPNRVPSPAPARPLTVKPQPMLFMDIIPPRKSSASYLR